MRRAAASQVSSSRARSAPARAARARRRRRELPDGSASASTSSGGNDAARAERAHRSRRARRRRRRPPARRRRAPAAARRSGRARRGTGRPRRSSRRAPGRAPPPRVAEPQLRAVERRQPADGVAGDEQSRAGARGLPRRVLDLLVRADHAQREHGPAVVARARGRSARPGAGSRGASRRDAEARRACRGRARSGRRSRSKRPNSRRQRRVLCAVRRGSRSCAVSTSGARVTEQPARRAPARRATARGRRRPGCGEPREPERVLERLQRQPQPRASEKARGERVEELAPPVAGRLGRVAEAEAGGDELDLGSGAGERRGELVVVRRRERGWVGDDDAHRS